MKRLHWLRPLLPPVLLGAVALAGALATPAPAPGAAATPAADLHDAEQLVRRYDRWFAGLDGGAALAARLAAGPGAAVAPPCAGAPAGP